VNKAQRSIYASDLGIDLARSEQTQQARQPAAAVTSGRSGRTSSCPSQGARKNRAGRRVAMPEELGRRHRVAVCSNRQQLPIRPMHFGSPGCAYNAPQQTVLRCSMARTNALDGRPICAPQASVLWKGPGYKAAWIERVCHYSLRKIIASLGFRASRPRVELATCEFQSTTATRGTGWHHIGGAGKMSSNGPVYYGRDRGSSG
jgi:hypothetical protein